MSPFRYTHVPYEELAKIGDQFCVDHGDDEYGLISREEDYFALFDHLAESLKRFGSFTEGHDHECDFCGSRYVHPHPVIQTVTADDLDPRIAIKAGIDATDSPPRPLGAAFDLHPNYLLIIDRDHVYGTYTEEQLQQGLTRRGSQAR